MSKQEREALIKALETIPKETIAEATAQVLDAVRRDRDRAFIDMIQTSASKDKSEEEKAFYMGKHTALQETYTKIATIIAKHGLGQ